MIILRVQPEALVDAARRINIEKLLVEEREAFHKEEEQQQLSIQTTGVNSDVIKSPPLSPMSPNRPLTAGKVSGYVILWFCSCGHCHLCIELLQVKEK